MSTRNVISDFPLFVRRWEEASDALLHPSCFVPDGTGRINSGGSHVHDAASTLTKWHPSFSNCLEEGVRDLVLLLIKDLDCITYSCCGGHRATDDHVFQARHVRMVSRTVDEWNFLLKTLQHFVVEVDESIASDTVKCCVEVSTLYCEKIGDVPSIDFLLVPIEGRDMDYWKDLDAVYCGVLELWQKSPFVRSGADF
jgi:hypothetical protein